MGYGSDGYKIIQNPININKPDLENLWESMIIYELSSWLVVSNMFYFHFIYGMSSFPLTNSIILQDGYCTTNQSFWSALKYWRIAGRRYRIHPSNHPPTGEDRHRIFTGRVLRDGPHPAGGRGWEPRGTSRPWFWDRWMTRLGWLPGLVNVPKNDGKIHHFSWENSTINGHFQ